MAHLDHARGRYRVLTYEFHLRVPWSPGYVALLKERYGVEMHPLHADVDPDRVGSYVEGYDTASLRLLNRKHGVDILEECYDQAKKKWREEHPEEAKRWPEP
jgi:hypothetical protein